jgi:hypothetical protein
MHANTIVQRRGRIDPNARFKIVLEVAGAGEAVVLRTAPDADRATTAFYDEKERLTRDRVAGDVLPI